MDLLTSRFAGELLAVIRVFQIEKIEGCIHLNLVSRMVNELSELDLLR